MKTKCLLMLCLMITSPALASDNAQEIREAVTCFPVEDMIKFLGKFEKLDADKRDNVGMFPSAVFTVTDGGAMPERFYVKDGDNEMDFTIQPDGSVPDFGKLKSQTENAELCAEDKTRAGRSKEDDGISLSIDMDVLFLENSGYHSLDVLKDGLKDGKSHYKKMMPGPMAMMVPKFSHVLIVYDNQEIAPQFTAMTGQNPVANLASEEYCEQTMIKVADIEALGADGLKVMGGDYDLLPVPNVKALKKFASCDEGDGE